MRMLLMMSAFLSTFLISGCAQKAPVLIKPKLTVVDAKTKPNHRCVVKGTIDAAGKVIVSKETAECIRKKLKICTNNNKKLREALKAANAQIFLLNNIKDLR